MYRRSEAVTASQQLSKLSEEKAELETRLQELGDAHALVSHQKGELEASLEAVRQQLSDTQDKLAAAEVGGLGNPCWSRLFEQLWVFQEGGSSFHSDAVAN